MSRKTRKWRVVGTVTFSINHEVEALTYEDALGIAENEVGDLRYTNPDSLEDDYIPDIDVEPEEESEDEDTDEESEDEQDG